MNRMARHARPSPGVIKHAKAAQGEAGQRLLRTAALLRRRLPAGCVDEGGRGLSQRGLGC